MAASVHTRPTARADLAGLVLAFIAAALILPGVLAFVAPGTFFDALAGYEPRNDHFLKDIGAFQIGLGLVAVLAWLRPDVRQPVLWILALHFALHTISHAIDVNHADPDWQGPFALVFEGAATAALAGLALREGRR